MCLMKKNQKNAILIGPCDITAISMFLKNIKIVDFNNTGTWNTCLSSYWVDCLLNKRSRNPFVDESCYPDKTIFEKENPILIMSILMEPQLGLYRNRYDNSTLMFGFPHLDIKKHYKDIYREDLLKFGEKGFEDIKNNYIFEGCIKPQQVIDNYKIILQSIPPDTKVCILLGPTFSSKYGEQNIFYQQFDIKKYFMELNSLMYENFAKQDNVELIDPSKFYKKPLKKTSMYYYNFMSISHYPRLTYYKIANYLHRNNRKFISLDYKKTLKILIKSIF